MSRESKQKAIVYCEGAFNTPNGKTAHGLVRFTRRYDILAILDSRYRGQDAGSVLDGTNRGIPILGSMEEAAGMADAHGQGATHFVVGLAPDSGRLSQKAREDVGQALRLGWNVDSGLHDFLSEDPELNAIASENGVVIRDVRKTPSRAEMHFFTGGIEKVSSFRIAVLGTDSAVGKRTTAWGIVEGFEQAGYTVEMIGTGQTAWLQGARYTVMLDSLINDFVTGEIEHVIVKAWDERKPDVIVVEGQGSLLNPAYPGGFEILAATRPDVIVLQHAPARREYDGFPGYPIHPLTRQIQALEIISGKPVVAIAVNHEGIPREEIDTVCGIMERTTGLPTVDTLVHGARRLVDTLIHYSK
ncbi:MAG: DUF1611 domain-containing protein [Candidatus Latescibacterota bacterium]|nr:MAG: DUF1611 domain-containing protein [Candidatus Latescibacterota bacterium]